MLDLMARTVELRAAYLWTTSVGIRGWLPRAGPTIAP